MKLFPEKLENHLTKALLPLYWISGDDFFLVEDAQNQFRKSAKTQGFEERIRIDANTPAQVEEQLKGAHQQALFSSKQLIELHFNQKKMNAAFGKVLEQYASQAATDRIVIIISPKLDAATKKTNWFNALEKIGGILELWPLESQQLSSWIKQRLKTHQLPTDERLVELIQEKTTGNLLATAQEIEKCALLYQSEPKKIERLLDSITDNARFGIFEFVDSALSGNSKKTLHALEHLKMEGAQPTLILWALARELRTLANISFECSQQKNFSDVSKKLAIWPKRQSLLQQYLKRTPLKRIYKQIQNAAFIDRLIKGFETGDVWEAFSRLSLRITGAMHD